MSDRLQVIGSELSVDNPEDMGEKILSAIDRGFEKRSEAEIENATGPEMATVRESIETLKQAIDASYLALGGLLYRVQNGRYFRTWGYDSFPDYLEEELGFKKRKGTYLIGIWKKFRVELGLKREDLRGIEWSKAKEIRKVANEENVDELLEKVREEDKSVREVEEMVDDIQAEERAEELKENGEVDETEEDDEPERIYRERYEFYDDQMDIVEHALSIASEYADRSREGYLLSMICTEYVANHADKGAKMAWLMGKLEDVFDIRIMAVDDDDDLVFGAETLDNVLAS